MIDGQGGKVPLSNSWISPWYNQWLTATLKPPLLDSPRWVRSTRLAVKTFGAMAAGFLGSGLDWPCRNISVSLPHTLNNFWNNLRLHGSWKPLDRCLPSPRAFAIIRLLPEDTVMNRQSLFHNSRTGRPPEAMSHPHGYPTGLLLCWIHTFDHLLSDYRPSHSSFSQLALVGTIQHVGTLPTKSSANELSVNQQFSTAYTTHLNFNPLNILYLKLWLGSFCIGSRDC